MKTIGILLVLLTVSSLFGCKYKNEAIELENQKQNLTLKLAKSDSLSDVYLFIIKDIESALDSIIPSDDFSESVPIGKKLRTRLTNKIDEINNMLLEQEKKHRAISSRIANSNATISEMAAKIEELDKEVKEKENINSKLNQTLKYLENQNKEQISKIESVIKENQKLNDALEAKTNAINSAYYISGSEDELRNKAIIEKTGGFLGLLGRVNTLNPELDINHLEIIDLREKTTFTLNEERRKIEFITHHHPSTYELNETSTGTSMLTITNPAEFWRNSKTLVITY
jgi:chromosome segregation ATPase